MSRLTIIWIVLGVVAAHVVAFFYFGQMHPLPKMAYVAPPNFSIQQITYVDEATGEKTVEKNIRVSTRLAPPGTYESQPPAAQPKAAVAPIAPEAHEEAAPQDSNPEPAVEPQ